MWTGSALILLLDISDKRRCLAAQQQEQLRSGRIWLGGLDNDNENDRNRKLHTEGTCEWILGHECYRTWLRDSKAGILWIYGIPGK